MHPVLSDQFGFPLMTDDARYPVFNGRFLSVQPTGVHRVAIELINALEADGSSPLVAAPHSQREPAINPKFVRPAGRLTGQAWEQVSLPAFAAGRPIVNLCNLAPVVRPGVVMIHDAQVHLTPQSYSAAFAAYYKTIQPVIGRRAERVLTVSEYSRQALARFGVAPLEKIGVIHNGVDHMLRAKPDFGVLERLSLDETPYVVALSNTQKHKNIALLFEAFRLPLLRDAKLVLVGSASAADFERNGASPSSNTVFAGRISDEEFSALLRRAACLAFPSTTEGFGLPPLEAMILGCPAVVAPCGAMPEVCGDAVSYADENSPTDWASAVQALFDVERRAAYGRVAKAHADQFSWRASAARLKAELLSLSIEI